MRIEKNQPDSGIIENLEAIWRVKEFRDLSLSFAPPVTDLFDLLSTRRSRRSFTRMDEESLSSLLWFAQRHTGTFSGNPGRVTSPIPTFGGLASVKTLVIERDKCWIYDPVRHRAGIIDTSKTITSSIYADAETFFSIGEGTLLLFAASQEYVNKYYENPESLVLRESGILTGTLALIAESYNLAFCPLGTPAEDWINALLNPGEGRIIPAGAAVIGNR